MSDDAVAAVLGAVEASLSAGSARFAWFMPEGDNDLAGGYGSGAVDLDRRRLAMVYRFLVPAADGGADQMSEVPSLIDGNDLYMAVPADDGGGEEWEVMEHTGLLASPVAPLWWLRGTVAADPQGGSAPSYQVKVHLATAIARAGEHERAAVCQSIDEAQAGLAEATVPGTVALDPQGRISRVELELPAGEAGVLPDAVPQRYCILEFTSYGDPATVTLPETVTRTTVAAFISAFLDQD